MLPSLRRQILNCKQAHFAAHRVTAGPNGGLEVTACSCCPNLAKSSSGITGALVVQLPASHLLEPANITGIWARPLYSDPQLTVYSECGRME
ncbi:hypothetical protein PoB_002159600 [Plakobranchus ocellatus]|uniref:Uncharacterized protein n=1 Tax=Plakobranchus ocellatus TaxID=259542 RepID=A0AAV3Z6Z2_9GAST|nr:hypothetical protein PoB_002159600 [Plakobranchus ocellatus]